MSNKTTFLVFSKNRTLQLKSLLLSLRAFSDITEKQITVLYKEDGGISYEPLKATFGCVFQPQKDFLGDVRAAIAATPSKYISFMVDDLICRKEFSIQAIEDFLDKTPEVDCFSLRLGKNIIDGKSPVFQEAGPFLVWETARGLGVSWNYFWELSGSVYRKQLVLDYLEKCDAKKVCFPNPLEEIYYLNYPSFIGGGWTALKNRIRFLFRKKKNRIASFPFSRCFTQGVNMVAGRGIEYKTVYSPQDLHQKMLEGYVIDFFALREIVNTKPNSGGQYFRLVLGNELQKESLIQKTEDTNQTAS